MEAKVVEVEGAADRATDSTAIDFLEKLIAPLTHMHSSCWEEVQHLGEYKRRLDPIQEP
jgi:hypothetical protein